MGQSMTLIGLVAYFAVLTWVSASLVRGKGPSDTEARNIRRAIACCCALLVLGPVLWARGV